MPHIPPTPRKAETLLRREPEQRHLAAYKEQRHNNHVEQLVREAIAAMSDPANYEGIDLSSQEACSNVKFIVRYEEEVDVSEALGVVRNLLTAFALQLSKEAPLDNPGRPIQAEKRQALHAKCTIPMPFVATSAEESARIIQKLSKPMLREARLAIFPQSGRQLQ